MKKIARNEKKRRLVAEARATEHENALKAMQMQFYGGAMNRPQSFQPLFPAMLPPGNVTTPTADLENVSIESVEIPHYLMN